MMHHRLVLGSGSPRRRELLAQIGLEFTLYRPDIDESSLPAEPSDQYVARLSREKSAVIPIHDPDTVILTADTTVADGDLILGKPATDQEAREMLTRLRGRPHVVHTGVTVRVGDTQQTRVITTAIHLRPYLDSEIDAYIARGEPFDKAGGYAIQDPIFSPVERFSGCYTNVIGLPLCVTCAMLREAGFATPNAPLCNPDSSERCEFQP
jgi:septum formation protein